MILKTSILILGIIACSYKIQYQNKIQVNIPTADFETDYIWRTIQDISFFEKHNYEISLPKGRYIELLKIKAKENSLSKNDYENLKAFIKDSVYKKSDYEQGYQKIESQRKLINTMISKITKSNYNWDFKKFNTYQINLTLYGPGGSYNSDEGSVLIYTTPNGTFKQYDNPANTIIHEITHIGIESSIVAKFKVPHPLKERIVDTFVFLNFANYLSSYKIQDLGDNRLDAYLKTKKSLKHLNSFVETIMNEN